jgi:hypothetical protein
MIGRTIRAEYIERDLETYLSTGGKATFYYVILEALGSGKYLVSNKEDGRTSTIDLAKDSFSTTYFVENEKQ